MHANEGLQVDLKTLQRRRSLRLLTGVAAMPLAGCGGGGSAAQGSALALQVANTIIQAASQEILETNSCSEIPSETAGPFPSDGTSNSSSGTVANSLATSGIVRSDITSSFGGFSGTALGVPLRLKLQLKNTQDLCAGLPRYAVYVWHCDASGRYSMYAPGVINQNYFRGLQVADDNGQVSFTTIVPGCYPGRWPHIHLQVFVSASAATSGHNALKVSQLALPKAICDQAYTNTNYLGSDRNLSTLNLATDSVFSDGSSLQLAQVTGDLDSGFDATLIVGLSR